MRSRLALAILAALLPACATTRVETPRPTTAARSPGVAARSPGVAAIRPPAPPAPELHALANPRIDVWEHRLHVDRAMREATEDSLARGAPYLPAICAILAEHHLPPDLALLPIVESGFWPNARGRSGERGLWQLRRATARRFGLVVNGHRDDRVNPERATRGAARYLRFLRARYGDWPLALAAYNAGEHRVDRALARDPDADFWRLADHGALPRTSREYVPRFLAVVRMTELGVFASSRPGCEIG